MLGDPELVLEAVDEWLANLVAVLLPDIESLDDEETVRLCDSVGALVDEWLEDSV